MRRRRSAHTPSAVPPTASMPMPAAAQSTLGRPSPERISHVPEAASMMLNETNVTANFANCPRVARLAGTRSVVSFHDV